MIAATAETLQTHGWWLASRASGLVALVLVTISVGIGLTMAGKLMRRPGVTGIAIPFAMGFRPAFSGIGILAGYLAALLGLSFYFRKRIGARLWRKAHRATVAVWLLGLVHAVGAGSDAAAPWFRWWVAVTTPPIAALFLYRVMRGKGTAERRGSEAVV